VDLAGLHSAINHFPVALSILGAAAALAALLLRRRTAWTYAAITLVVAALAAWPTLFTGEEAEEVIEERWFADKQVLHEHEEAGELAMWLEIAAGAAALVALWSLRGKAKDALPAAWVQGLLLIAALASAGATARAGWEGGKIVIKNPRLASPPAGSVAPGRAEPDR
jgi:uncharacterized membrane protein